MSWIVRVTDDEQGYADEEIFGPFRSRERADAFAERVEAHIKNPDEIHVHVDRLARPVLRGLRERGWFDWAEGVDS